MSDSGTQQAQDVSKEYVRDYMQVAAKMYKTNAREKGDKTWPPVPYYDVSAGSDRYLNAVQKPLPSQYQFLAKHGITTPYMNADKSYNLNAQVAAYAYVHQQTVNPALDGNRMYRPNTLFGQAANQHDISCWYAADLRDRALQKIPGFERRGYDSLSDEEKNLKQIKGYTAEERQLNPALKEVRTPQEEYEASRFQTDLALYTNIRDWQPEGVEGQKYRSLALTGFQLLIEGYKTMPEYDKNHPDVDPPSYAAQFKQKVQELEHSHPIPGDPAVHFPATRIVPVPPIHLIADGVRAAAVQMSQSGAFEKMVTLPMSEREQSFFYRQGAEATDLGTPKWVPDAKYPPERPDAMMHGHLVIDKMIDGHKVQMSLDLETRVFEKTIHDPAGRLTVSETRTPTSPLTQDNFFTPSYEVRVTQVGLDVPQLLQNEKITDIHKKNTNFDQYTDKVTHLAAGPAMPKVLKNNDNYKEHLARLLDYDQGVATEQPNLHALMGQDTEQQWHNNRLTLAGKEVGLVYEPKQGSPAPALADQPIVASPVASLGRHSSTMDILDALHQATLNRDDKAVAQVVQAYAQTPAAQAFMQEGKAQNEQAKAQEQQAATMVQVEPESQQRSAPSMRR